MNTYREYLEAEGDANPIDIARDIEWLNDKYKRIKKIGAPAFRPCYTTRLVSLHQLEI